MLAALSHIQTVTVTKLIILPESPLHSMILYYVEKTVIHITKGKIPFVEPFGNEKAHFYT